MAKILTFRNKGGNPSDQDFLRAGDETLSFRMDEDGGVSLGEMAQVDLNNLFPDPKKDWSNQELADLFRVRQLLSAANVAVETDRGVTDEGDPWFVFCHSNGDVFIHLCRIDGCYVLDSPNVLRPLRGADFSELISDFTNKALPADSDEDEATRRVIKLERGGKVQLHPSAMLAALIWTLFLASEELVLLAPEGQVFDDDALLDLDGLLSADTAEHTGLELLIEDDKLDAASLLLEDGVNQDHAAQEIHVQTRETLVQQQGLTVQNPAITMGLSTIAIAMGFMSETVLLDNQRKVMESLKQLGFSVYGDEEKQVADLDIPDDAEGAALLTMLAEFLGLDLSGDTKIAEAAPLESDGSSEKQELTHLSDKDTASDPVSKAVKTAKLTNSRDDTNSSHVLLEASEATQDNPDALVSENSAPKQVHDAASETATLSLSEIVQAWLPEMEKFQMGEATLTVDFDILETDASSLFSSIDAEKSNSPEVELESFEIIAERMFEFLQSKSSDFGIVELRSGNGIVFVDRSAASEGELQIMQWEANDGKIVSLIGLASDVQQFDMTA